MTTLSPRELQVLDHLSFGYTKAEVAGFLGTKVPTVRAQASNILRKLGAQNVTHAVAIGLREGIIE